MTVALLVIAAFAGTLLRVAASGLDTSFNRRMWGTLAVNLAGAFLLGWLQTAEPDSIAVLGVGGLGALTTFSTFVSQIECIDREGRRRDAVAYAAGTVLLGILAAWLGMSVG